MHIRWISTAAGCAVLCGVGCLNLLFPFAPDQIFETQVRAQCRFQFQCCTAAERSLQFPDEATCVEVFFEQNAAQALIGQRAQQAIAAGTAEQDAELAERCLRPFLDAANSCDPTPILGRTPPDPACEVGLSRAFAVGLVKDGDDCVDDIECADQGDCVVDNDDPQVVTLAGTCRARAGDGDDCSERECQSGLLCERDGEDARCTEIELLDKGDACFDDGQCATGFCNPGALSGTCFFAGETPCDEDGDCDEDEDDFCDFDDDDEGECDDGPNVEICDGQ